jgi:hypothetical protein
MNDIDLKRDIPEKCHETDPYYYQIYYFKYGLRLGLAPINRFLPTISGPE